jgi:hypothetical protein
MDVVVRRSYVKSVTLIKLVVDQRSHVKSVPRSLFCSPDLNLCVSFTMHVRMLGVLYLFYHDLYDGTVHSLIVHAQGYDLLR